MVRVIGTAGAVPVVSAITYAVGNPAGGGTTRRVVTVNDSTGCTGIKAGGVAFTSFAIDSSFTVSGIPGAHAAGVVDVVVTNATGDSTTGTGLYEYWAPTTETLGTFHEAPNYTRTTGTDGVWVATVGTNLTQTGNPDPVASGGAPDFEWTTDFGLGNAVDTSTWCGTGDHTLFAVLRPEQIHANSVISYSNDCIIQDSSAYLGLFLRNNSGTFTLYFYEWDTGERKASVDVTSLLTGIGVGYLIVQGRKTGGSLYVRAIGATGTGTWTVGDACGTMDSASANLRVGGGGSSGTDGIIYAVGAANTVGWSDAISTKFEKWAQAEHP